MTLEELSETYREAAKPLRERLKQLRMELVTETNPQIAFCLKTRIAQMTPILTQLNELAELTELVSELDPNAFIIVQEAHQVLGDGFKRYSKNGL